MALVKLTCITVCYNKCRISLFRKNDITVLSNIFLGKASYIFFKLFRSFAAAFNEKWIKSGPDAKASSS